MVPGMLSLLTRADWEFSSNRIFWQKIQFLENQIFHQFDFAKYVLFITKRNQNELFQLESPSPESEHLNV